MAFGGRPARLGGLGPQLSTGMGCLAPSMGGGHVAHLKGEGSHPCFNRIYDIYIYILLKSKTIKIIVFPIWDE